MPLMLLRFDAASTRHYCHADIYATRHLLPLLMPPPIIFAIFAAIFAAAAIVIDTPCH